MQNLAALIADASSGDTRAFEEIVVRFQDMAYGYAYSILRDFHLAEDAAQEAFVEAYQNLSKLRDADRFAGWFRRIVLYRCNRIMRGRRLPTVPLEDALDIPSTDPSPHHTVEEREMRERVIEAVHSLSQPLREVTALFYMNGYSKNEISEFLEVPVNTVKSRLHSSRKQLREKMIPMVRETLDEHKLPDDFARRGTHPRRTLMKQPEIDYWIASMLHAYDGACDLNVTAGKPLQVESAGELRPVAVEPEVTELTPFQAEVFALNIIRNDHRLLRTVVSTGSCDLPYHLGKATRLRANVFTQKGNLSTVLRLLETTVPTIEKLGLQPVFNSIAKESSGLILVTGATGSGKSATLAALMNRINEDQSVHIVTLEDPVEFLHPHRQATFSQRELGTDFDTLASGLRAALRQSPKVIMVSELRDLETVALALSAAECGHLVLSTLHTVDASQTINRILGMFEEPEQNQVRIRLADTVRYFDSQRLLPRVGGGRTAAFEIMSTNRRIRDIVTHGESEGRTLYEAIESGPSSGMQTFEQSIIRLLSEGQINETTALAYASRQDVVRTALDAMVKERGEETPEMPDSSVAGLVEAGEPEPEGAEDEKAGSAEDSQLKQGLPEPEDPSASPPRPPDTSWLSGGEETAPDTPVALVLMKQGPDRKMLTEAFRANGYQLEYPESADDAIQRMQHDDYAAAVLHAGFEGSGSPDPKFHSHMKNMAMTKRHGILYVMVGPDYRTLYDLEALARSANAVVNDSDLRHMNAILMRAKSSYEELFGPYIEMRRSLGLP